RQYVATEPAARGQPRTVLSFLPDLPPSDVGTGERPGAALIAWQPPLPDKAKPADGDRDRADAADPPTLARSLAPSAPVNRFPGQVVLITTTVNREWADWPVSPSFLPFMQELVRSAAS